MVLEKKTPFRIIREISHPFFTLTLRSDGIVQMNTEDNAYFTLKEAKEYLTELEKITDGVPHLILKLPGKHASVDSITRTFMATDEALRFSIAEAVLVRSLSQRLIGNFYLKFDKPVKPIRLFDNIDLAEKWLMDFADNY